jgi:hypothetical protein
MKYSSGWARALMIAALGAVMAGTPIFVSRLEAQDAQPAQPAPAQPVPPAQPPGGRRGRGPSLGGDMRSMNQAFTKIKAQYSDPTQNESTLTALATFETQVVAAKSALPPAISRLPDADKKAATEKYRGMLRNLLRASLDLEDQITAGDMDKAKATIATMSEIETNGHAAFRPEGG